MEPEGSLPQPQVPANCHYPELRSSSNQSTTPHPTFWKFILILSSYLRLGLPSGSLSFRFPHQNPVYTSPPPHTCYMPHPSHSGFDQPNNSWWGIQIIKLLIMLFSPFPCYLVPLRPKYSNQQHIPKHPQPPFLSQCERPSITQVQNNRKNYSSIYLNIYIFG